MMISMELMATMDITHTATWITNMTTWKETKNLTTTIIKTTNTKINHNLHILNSNSHHLLRTLTNNNLHRKFNWLSKKSYSKKLWVLLWIWNSQRLIKMNWLQSCLISWKVFIRWVIWNMGKNWLRWEYNNL